MSKRSARFTTGLFVLTLIATLVQLAVPARAQTFRGGIHGTVEDPSGALVSGAEVKARNAGTSQVYSTVATSAGEFTFPDFPWVTIPFQ